MRVCVFWDIKISSGAGIGSYAFWRYTMASSWRVLVDTEKVITWAWRQCIPLKFHEPLALEYGVTSPKTVILNYPVGTPHIICNDFTSQQPTLSPVSVPRSKPGSVCFASQHHSLRSLLITPLPSVSQTMNCTKASDKSVGCATESDLEIYSSKGPWGPCPQIH